MMRALVILILSVHSISAFADKEVGNGGDLCESRIQEIRADIRSWIDQGGHLGLALPSGVTPAKYKATMSSAISNAVVSCTEKTIKVRGVEKMCVNRKRAGKKPSIVCNRKSFNQSGSIDQYVLVHHEFAGVAGLETNKSEESEYEISNQISSYLTVRRATKLAIEKRPVPSPNEIRKNFGDLVGNYKISACEFQVNDEKKKPRSLCDMKYVEIYFATQYYPPAKAGEPEAELKLAANYTNELGVPSSMAFIAYETSKDDMICTNAEGLQSCTSQLRGFVFTTTLQSRNGKVFLNNTFHWPEPTRDYLFRRTSMELERID